MLNHIVLMGRLVRDPEMRYTQSNLPVTSFTIAVDRDIPGQNGNREVDFIDCVAWRKAAEFVNKYFMKGNMIALEGRLQMRDWTDKNGNKRRSAEVLVNQAHFAGGKNESSSAAPANTYPAYPATQNADDFDMLDGEDAQIHF